LFVRGFVNELGLRVKDASGEVEEEQAVDFSAEPAALEAYLSDGPTQNLLLIVKKGGLLWSSVMRMVGLPRVGRLMLCALLSGSWP
jgi:hypothetical protein